MNKKMIFVAILVVIAIGGKGFFYTLNEGR